MNYIFLDNGFEEIEAFVPIDLLRRVGMEVVVASLGQDLGVKGAHGIGCLADTLLSSLEVENFEFSRTAPQQGEYKITCYSDKQDMIERLVCQISNIVEIKRAYYTI